jgi:predicted AlkP superfamily phosphohydrolase/phosphomutase
MGSGLPLFQIPLSSGLALNPLYTMRSVLLGSGVIRFTSPPRALLNGKPVWELLHEAGVDSAVVRFRFTYPPERQARVIVSDWVGDDQWSAMGVQRVAGDAVTPRDRADLIAPFLRDAPSDVALVADMLPGPTPPQPADMKRDPIAELRLSLDIDGRTFEAAETIIRGNRAQPFLAVYFGGLDSVEHAFWQYAFPEDFPANPPAPKDVDRLGPVIGRYVEYFDRRLGQLLSRYEQEPNVVIVSDHGMGPTTFSSDFRGWHAKDGMFLAAGPSVPHDPASIQVSYYDVLPTILRLMGFEKPEALRGRSVLPADGE